MKIIQECRLKAEWQGHYLAIVETRPHPTSSSTGSAWVSLVPLHISWEELEGLPHPLQWVWPITCLQVGEEVTGHQVFFFFFMCLFYFWLHWILVEAYGFFVVVCRHSSQAPVLVGSLVVTQGCPTACGILVP